MSKLPEMTAYYNEAMDITLAVPVGWTGKVLSPQAFRIFSQPEPKFDDYRGTLSVEKVDVTEDAPENIEYNAQALESLIAQAEDDLKRNMENYQSLREQRYTSQNNLPGYAHWFSWQDPESGKTFSQIQAFLLTAGGDLYIFNAATLKSLESRYMPVFDHIIQSAQIAG